MSMDQQFWASVHITQHAEGQSCPVYDTILCECFPGGASGTQDKPGPSKQQLGEEHSSGGKACGVALTFPTLIFTFV